MIDFCFDNLSGRLGYPNLAPLGLTGNQFDQTWPRCTPLRLFVYFDYYCLAYRCHQVESAPAGSWYPVALAWFDFDLDYFALLSDNTRKRLQQRDIRVLFYYHEGDNPSHIQQRLASLCVANNLPADCYRFISANSAASGLNNCYYFPDHEFFFRYINRRQDSLAPNTLERGFDFTALNRTHKWWRCSIMSDLLANDLLKNSLWSYNTRCDINEKFEDNPIEIDSVPGLRENMREFMSGEPYVCDSKDDSVHNDHRMVNTDLFAKSYFHIVIETHFDADQSQGAFITEKTFKCIKFAQPFVVAGTVGTLRSLREMGYRVFDHVIDNSYDTIADNTQRWKAVKRSLVKLKDKSLHCSFQACYDDLCHNQQVFYARERQPLTQLYRYLS